MPVTLRPFTEADRPRHVEIVNQIYPDAPRSVEAGRHEDSLWDGEKHFRLRLVAEAQGRMVGFGRLSHMPGQFHPDKYRIHLEVEPASQLHGIGTALFESLLAEAQGRNALLVRAEAKESMTPSIAFLAHRKFEEIQRNWESRLDVAGFDLDSFEKAEERALGQGITLTTIADEGVDNPDVLRQVYELDVACSQDEPSVDPITSSPFDLWVKDSFGAPWSYPEGFFLAKDGDRYVGLSALFQNVSLPQVLQQGFTAVDRDYRAKGIAMALKIRGVKLALDRGYHEIRTWNNTRNRPMLRINEAMGFAKQPVWIEFAKQLRRAGSATT